MPRDEEHGGLPRVQWDQFEGLDAPTYTQTPDAIFDWVMAYLGEAELKVLLYIVRRTFGFRKAADEISVDQMCNGILTRDGRRLDLGTGLKASTVKQAVRSLKQKNLILAEQRSDPTSGSRPTVYRLNLRAAASQAGIVTSIPGGMPRHTGGYVGTHAGGREDTPAGSGAQTPGMRGDAQRGYVATHPQQTDIQETVKQETEQQQKSVVELLTSSGVTRKTAQQIANQYPLHRITAHVDMLAWRSADNPAAVLVRAIREDWAPPPGYQSPSERELDKLAREHASNEQRRKRRGWREEMIQRYEIDVGTIEIWEQAGPIALRYVGPSTYKLLFADALLLPLKGTRARVLLREPWHKLQVRADHKEGVERALCSVLGRPVSVEFVSS